MPDRPNGLQTDVDLLRAEVARLKNECRELTSVQDTFLQVSAALSAKAGDEFFTSLVAHLSQSLGMECVCVAQVIDPPGDRMRTTAMAMQGRVVPNIEYGLRDTPCETIFGRELAYYAEGVCRRFPRDQFLIDMRAESYIGAPLFDSTGRPLGLVAAIDTKPLAHARLVAAIFAMLAARVADELERKQSRRALGESEERVRLAFEAARMGAFDWKAGARKSEFFGNMMALFGRTPDDEHAGYADFLQSIHPDDRARVDEAVRRALQGGEGYNVEFRAVWPDGTLHWIAETGRVHRDADGTPVRMVGIAMDIDERKRLEQDREQLDARVQQAQKLEMLGTLAGGVAHDFNNLLQAILSNSGLIREQAPASPAVLNCLDQIDIATQRASELTRQLLAYAGKGRLVSEAVDLSQLALEMSRLLEASLPKRARIQGQFPPGLPPVEGDPTQVRQVVMNLVLNAAEALPDGSGTIRLAAGLVHLSAEELSGLVLGSGLSAGKYLYFEVCDTGVGMTDEARARIFDPFYTTKDKGRGLGLAAVLGIVRSHQGAIQVHSEPGEGTVFRVLFPASDRSARSRLAADPEPTDTTPDQTTILVVDDESAIRNAAQLLLEAHGFRVVTAGNGLEALQIFRERHADLSAVLLDLTMPHMDGSKAFRELRAIRPDIPILVTSGYSAEEAGWELQDDGPAGFIQKPYRAAQLRAKLQEVLQVRQPHVEP